MKGQGHHGLAVLHGLQCSRAKLPYPPSKCSYVAIYLIISFAVTSTNSFFSCQFYPFFVFIRVKSEGIIRIG